LGSRIVRMRRPPSGENRYLPTPCSTCVRACASPPRRSSARTCVFPPSRADVKVIWRPLGCRVACTSARPQAKYQRPIARSIHLRDSRPGSPHSASQTCPRSQQSASTAPGAKRHPCRPRRRPRGGVRRQLGSSLTALLVQPSSPASLQPPYRVVLSNTILPAVFRTAGHEISRVVAPGPLRRLRPTFAPPPADARIFS
jgi:hypothetical protein